MSELISVNAPLTKSRLYLLTTASALALLTAACAQAYAEDAARPTVWIEVGGMLEQVGYAQDPSSAPFLMGSQALPPFPVSPRPNPMAVQVFTQANGTFDRSQPLSVQSPPKQNFGGEARVEFEPVDSGWNFSAAVRYGRSNGAKHAAQQTSDRHGFLSGFLGYLTPTVEKFSNANSEYSQNYVIADFSVGKDVGLGLFGRNSRSVFNAGVRFAQFSSKSSVRINADPDLRVYNSQHTGFFGAYNKYGTRFQTYALAAHSARSFHGIGPSLSLKGSTPLVGNAESAELAVDWGLNGALLFGRQRAQTDHKTTAYDRYRSVAGFHPNPPLRVLRYRNSIHHTRSEAITVPNIGAFAALSARYANARVTVGYRADFFFGAMDAGIDTRHIADMNFHGPFARISIGLGG